MRAALFRGRLSHVRWDLGTFSPSGVREVGRRTLHFPASYLLVFCTISVRDSMGITFRALMMLRQPGSALS